MPTWSLYVTDDLSGTDGNTIDLQATSDSNGTWDVTLRDILYDAGSPARVDGDTGSRQHCARLDATQGANQRASGKPDNAYCGPMVLQQTDGTGYWMAAASKFGNWEIWKLTGTTGAPFGDATSIRDTGVSRGGADFAMLECTVSGSTTTLQAYADSSDPPTTSIGTSIGDTTWTSGHPGMSIYSTNIHLIGNFRYYEDTDEGGGGATPKGPLGHPLHGALGGPIG